MRSYLAPGGAFSYIPRSAVCGYLFSSSQFHLRSDSALRVGLPFSSFIGPGIPPIRAQNDLRRFAGLLSGSNFDGLVVTAIESLEPGFSLRYEAIPLRFKPPSGFLPSLRCHAADSYVGLSV